MFKRLKSLFQKKKEILVWDGTEKYPMTITTVQLDPLKYLPPVPKCKEHWEYQGLAVPTNQCTTCWDMYDMHVKREQFKKTRKIG